MLTRDAIVETRPVAVNRRDDAAARRRVLFDERRKQVPAGLDKAATWIGLTVDLPEDAPDASMLRWTDAAGAPIAESYTSQGRAEIGWRGEFPRGTEFRLATDDGDELARVKIDSGGEAEFSVWDSARGTVWIGVDAPSVEGNKSKDPARRLQWRGFTGQPIPTLWRGRQEWAGGRGVRVDLPVGPLGGANRVEELLLTDDVTGWSLATAVQQRY